MKKTSDRRSFIKNIGIGGVSAAVLPLNIKAVAEEKQHDEINDKPDGEKGTRVYNSHYADEYLNRVAFPIGGIGAGMFCLEGTGTISHMSIKTALMFSMNRECSLQYF